MNWGYPKLLADNNSIDYQYHAGATLTTPGIKPNEPTGTGTNPDNEGWYDTPDAVEADGGEVFWLAQRNWAEGVTAQWVVYQIRGENGADGADGADGSDGSDGDPADIPDEIQYTALQPYEASNTGSISPSDVTTLAGTPTTDPGNWTEERITGSAKAPTGAWDASDFASTYKTIKPDGGSWGNPIIITDRSGIDWGDGLTYDTTNDTFTTGGGMWTGNNLVMEVARLNDMATVGITSGNGSYSRFTDGDVIKFSSSWGRPENAAAWTKIN